MDIILASASERRRELLGRIVENFQIVVSNFDESKVEFQGDCGAYVINLAKGKALNVGSILNTHEDIIIASDTVVFLDDKVLGKPNDKDEAYDMLKSLSGKTHQVYSGIAIYNTVTEKMVTDYVCTEVKFSNVPEDVILKYVESGEPMDKAGAYGIQGYGGIFVEKINGCYYNVVGLPLNKLYFLLKEMGVNL